VDPGGVEKQQEWPWKSGSEARNEGGHENENESDAKGPIAVAEYGRFI
jgi:hypothetical protein